MSEELDPVGAFDSVTASAVTDETVVPAGMRPWLSVTASPAEIPLDVPPVTPVGKVPETVDTPLVTVTGASFMFGPRLVSEPQSVIWFWAPPLAHHSR